VRPHSDEGRAVPILKQGEIDIISHSAVQTMRLGMRIGALLRPGDVICLSGDMGAGKTVFTAGIGQGWGSEQPVTSPTFNLVHEYTRAADDQVLYHLDCYRLNSPAEAERIGLDDILSGNGPAIFEWPERIEAVLPRERLWLHLRVVEPTRRNLVFEARGTRYQQLLDQFRELSIGNG
jgi:tRNA threonylcarbamoyladenosine biosynthesis protein TsaE